MPEYSSSRRFVILTQGQTHPTSAKMAAGILRYQREQTVALLDSSQAGHDCGELMGVGHGVPILASIAEAQRLGANALLLGITPAGGQLPPDWRAIILQAMEASMDIYSGLHSFLNDDAEFVDKAYTCGVQLVDLRAVPHDLTVNKCRAVKTATFRIHTVGTDCNCGKKVTALEMHRRLVQLGKRSEFIATGQTGVLISGKGLAMDRVISDFVSGAAERLVLENARQEYLVIEGQGALLHPLYSGVTLGMLHGFAPQALVLCHQPDRGIMRGTPETPVPTLSLMIDLYERITRPLFPCKVVGVALNCMALTDAAAAAEVQRVEAELGLATTDVVRFGAERLVQAALDFQGSLN